MLFWQRIYILVHVYPHIHINSSRNSYIYKSMVARASVQLIHDARAIQFFLLFVLLFLKKGHFFISPSIRIIYIYMCVCIYIVNFYFSPKSRQKLVCFSIFRYFFTEKKWCNIILQCKWSCYSLSCVNSADARKGKFQMKNLFVTSAE